MIKRMLAVVLATTALALLLAAAAPRPAEAVAFVDKQVQAGGLLIQNYINAYGMKHGFMFPDKAAVKKGGGLEDKTRIWPSNPWTGKLMGPGTSRGTYTYTLRNSGTAYTLTMHFSKGAYVFKGTMPTWFKNERNTASKQNLLLLQRYVESYATTHAGTYPAPADVTAAGFGTGYAWPKSPWSGADMAQSEALGDFRYIEGGATYSLKVMLTGGWSSPALGPLQIGQLIRLTVPPGG